MDSWAQSALKSILRGDPIFESTAWFFVIILKFIYISIFEIEITPTAWELTENVKMWKLILESFSLVTKIGFEEWITPERRLV